MISSDVSLLDVQEAPVAEGSSGQTNPPSGVQTKGQGNDDSSSCQPGLSTSTLSKRAKKRLKRVSYM